MKSRDDHDGVGCTEDGYSLEPANGSLVTPSIWKSGSCSWNGRTSICKNWYAC
jgi:hypothetical protein